MQYLSYALPLAALASGAFANPLERRGDCTADACLAVVTGKAALGDDGLRGGHCASFLATTVTPPAVTVTSTITGSSSGDLWKRASVTVCPNEVPNYASACDETAYSSACACFGYTDVLTTTIAPTTTTKTVYVAPTGAWTVVSGSTCPTPVTSTTTSTVTVGGSGSGYVSTTTSTVTVGGSGSGYVSTATVTVTASGYSKGNSSCTSGATSTVTIAGSSTCPAASTVTVGGSSSAYVSATTVTVSGTCSSTSTAPSTTTSSAAPSSCVVTDAIASGLAANFTLLLENTSYNGTQGAPGTGYPQDVSDATLASDFSDISDSINFMAGFPLGSVTFPSKAAFDYGQGVLQPEVSVQTLNVWHDCSSVTWRWRLTAFQGAYPVNGINHMIVDSDAKIQKNYAEFDNGAWLQSFGQQCATSNVTVTSPAATKRSIDGALRVARGFQN